MYKLSESLENYLETIYLLSLEGDVRLTDIGAKLNVSKPSVHKALHALEDEKLITHVHYGAILLTEEGLKAAKSVLFRHTSIKKFLVEKLKVSEKTAEEDACRMEHVMSPETIKKLLLYMHKGAEV